MGVNAEYMGSLLLDTDLPTIDGHWVQKCYEKFLHKYKLRNIGKPHLLINQLKHLWANKEEEEKTSQQKKRIFEASKCLSEMFPRRTLVATLSSLWRFLSQSRVKVAAAAAVAHASDLLLLGTATHSKGRWDAMGNFPSTFDKMIFSCTLCDCIIYVSFSVGKEEAGPREDASRPGTRLRTKKAPFCRRDRRDEIWQRKQ